MKISFIQLDVKHSLEENLNNIENHLSGLDCRLAVLPELSLCGYLFESREDLAAAAEPSTRDSMLLTKDLTLSTKCCQVNLPTALLPIALLPTVFLQQRIS